MSWRNRKKYPKHWEDLSYACRERASWRCEHCGCAEGEWRTGVQRVYQIKLAAAHLDRDPWNPDPRLKALCQDCHFKFDRLDNGRDASRARKQNQRKAMVAAGQIELFNEVAS